MRASKGSAFEREISKLLSLWWTNGQNDAVFWRTSQSGGRATSRAKKGQSTAFSHGDISAIDPIGIPFLKKLTLELKRGNSHGTLVDLLDDRSSTKLPIQETFRQAIKSAKAAGTEGWMIIHKRDRKLPMVYIDWYSALDLGILKKQVAFYHVQIPQLGAIRFLALALPDFFKRLDPYAYFWNRGDSRPT